MKIPEPIGGRPMTVVGQHTASAIAETDKTQKKMKKL
jgi:hypothetical protein